MKPLVSAVALAGLLAGCAAPVATPPSLTSLQANVARLKMSDGLCSAWFSKKHQKFITAGHCFDWQVGTGVLTLNDGTEVNVETEKFVGTDGQANKDFVFLKPMSDVKLPGLDICTSSPYYGEEIVMMGEPLGRHKLMFFGHVANPNTTEEDFDSKGGLYVDMEQWPGNSGGPIMDRQTGCVIGQAEATFKASSDYDIAVGVNYAAPISNLN